MIDHKTPVPFTRGLRKVDEMLSKPWYDELIILAGYPGMGKTEFTHFVARANADKWVKVCYLSLELTREALALRYAIKSAAVKWVDYQDRKYSEAQKDIIDRKYKEFIEYKNISVVGDDRTYTLSDLIKDYPDWEYGILDEYYSKGYKLFIIDNLGKIWGYENELKAHAEITSALQDRKKKTKACVILLHHMWKRDKRSGTGEGWVEWIRGSQKIIDNASQVLEIYRNTDPEEMDQEEKAKVRIKQYKHTMAGVSGYAEIYFNKWTYEENYHRAKKPLPAETEEDELF